MKRNKKTILIGKDDSPYLVPLTLRQSAVYVDYLRFGCKRELDYIFNLMDLGSRTRKLFDNEIDFESNGNTRKGLRVINKGLSMELLTSYVLSYIDNPTQVHPNCTVTKHDDNKVIPKNYAQGGEIDIVIDYPEFKLLVEVSAKHQPSLSHYKKQVENALKHARKLREEGEGKLIHCLLVNERSLSIQENKLTMLEICKDIKEEEEIYLTSLSTEEFSIMGDKLGKEYEEDTEQIKSKELLEVFNRSAVNHMDKQNSSLDDSIINFLSKNMANWF